MSSETDRQLVQKSCSRKSLGRVVGKPEKCPRKWAMQLKKCRTSRLRAMLARTSFVIHLSEKAMRFYTPFDVANAAAGTQLWPSRLTNKRKR